MIADLRIVSGRAQLLREYKSNNKSIESIKIINANVDKIQISNEGMKHASEAEKIANRRKIDTAAGAVGYDCNSRIFLLPDGSRISADDVSTKIGEDEYIPVQVKDNKLSLEPGNYYRLTDKNGVTTTFACSQYGLDPHSFSQRMINGSDELTDDSDKVELLTFLANDGNVIGVNMFFEKDWAVNTLKDLGFTPGKASIHRKEGNSGDFFLGYDNRLHTVSGAQSRIQAINLTNYLELGVSSDSVWKIDGEEYSMNEQGYFNIPMDAMCIPGSMELIDRNGNPVVIHA